MSDKCIQKRAPPVPKETIARILSAKLQDPQMRISTDVVEAITRYTDIFIRETILRSIEAHNNAGGGQELDYTDLEQIVGLLLTDM